MAVSEDKTTGGPKLFDLDHCIHCGLCLNACPTYRELGLEMDSPRGRIYQMVKVATGEMPVSEAYIRHIDLCLACRGCETACPSGVQYGRLVEAARAQIETVRKRSWAARVARTILLNHVVESRTLLAVAGAALYLYQVSGLQRALRSSGLFKLFERLGRLEVLTPAAEAPFFFDKIGNTYPAEGERQFRVAFLAGCIANVCFARLNEATVRVLQKNGCEVVIPAKQGCCGALHVHTGLRDEARKLARRNIDAVMGEKFDAIITNAAGCGSTLKEYGELLEDDAEYAERARRFAALTKDITEFLASIELNRNFGEIQATVTYQDSCHLLHGQKIRMPPRRLLGEIPGLTFRELPAADVCCGSAGIYNVVENDMAMAVLEKKMHNVKTTGANVVATANPGCLLQLKAGVRLFGDKQRVAHVVEILDEAYRKYSR